MIIMTDPIKPTDPARLLNDLQQRALIQQQPIAAAVLDPQLALLRMWQSQRLAQTYADLLADPQTGPALRFFLSDLYAPRDFSQRDHDVERIYAFVSQVLPAQTLQVLTAIIALNRLTVALDHDLCRVLVDQLGVTDTITPACYAEAYRICANADVRADQIDRIATVLARVGAGAHLPVISLALFLARIPAQRAGWGEIYDLLSRGYAAFRQLRDVPTFVGIITQRERRILDQIYAGAADPFTI
ncbi:MAG: hypothetical protein HGB28_00105 [Oscillochloris sp.]|nr:hypothetical protein [Oscillochloris sp.]